MGYKKRSIRLVSTCFCEVSADDLRKAQRDNQVIGTVDECIDKIRFFQKVTQAQEFVFICQFGGMPMDRAKKSMKLFSEKVLPVMHDLKV